MAIWDHTLVWSYTSLHTTHESAILRRLANLVKQIKMTEDMRIARYNKKIRRCDCWWLHWNCLQKTGILSYFILNNNWRVAVTAHAHQPWGRIHSAALCRSRGWCRTISCRHAARQRCSRCSCGHCRGRGSGTEHHWSFHLVLPQWLE